MKTIRVLDKNLSNMIAAGEVVERPASVVKELAENSIDSGADSITVEIKNGGKTYIRVTDNGCGMTEDDAQVSFTRHATSKIMRIEDLSDIDTMGFRGEALAAISSVSKVEMLTAVSDDIYGTRVVVEGGEQLCCETIGLPHGTTIVVKDLFYNTPARMNFMKKDSTESANIISLVNKLAIGNHNISFKLIADGKVVLSTDKSSGLKNIIYSVLGSEISESLLAVERLDNNICVTGFTGSPRCSRANRNFQLFYVNGRIVKSKTLTVALDRAYSNLLMNGKYAVTVIRVSLPYNLVDVNVHPTKTEVKFSNESSVFDAVYYALKDALNSENQINDKVTEYFAPIIPSDNTQNKDISYIKPYDFTDNADENKRYTVFASDNIADYNPKEVHYITDTGFTYEDYARSDETSLMDSGIVTLKEAYKSVPTTDDTGDLSFLLKSEIPYRLVGEMFNTYIVIESGTSFYLVDKHAAHERIIFNRIYDRYKTDDHYTQQLIAGVPVTLSPVEGDTARQYRDQLEQLGYGFDEFGDNDVILRSVPYVISPTDVASAFTELLGIISEGKNIGLQEFEDRTIKMLACKAAIKAGYHSTADELDEFIKKLLLEGNARYCPHGRPIFIEYTIDSVEKLFRRKL